MIYLFLFGVRRDKLGGGAKTFRLLAVSEEMTRDRSPQSEHSGGNSINALICFKGQPKLDVDPRKDDDASPISS